MKAIWSGSISSGLVNIPVKLFSGSQSNTLDLDMIRKSDLCPIKYLRVCKHDNKEVPYEEIVKGYEYKDAYIEDLKRIIEEKAQGRQPRPQGKEPQATKVVDMMALLKESLKHKRKETA
jgi:non-homologous end joining protein Ku